MGRSIWLGSASFDDRVGFSHTTGQVTHQIAADVDTARDFLATTLETTKQLESSRLEASFHDALQGFNGGGDPWKTDGTLWVGVIQK